MFKNEIKILNIGTFIVFTKLFHIIATFFLKNKSLFSYH